MHCGRNSHAFGISQGMSRSANLRVSGSSPTKSFRSSMRLRSFCHTLANSMLPKTRNRTPEDLYNTWHLLTERRSPLSCQVSSRLGRSKSSPLPPDRSSLPRSSRLLGVLRFVVAPLRPRCVGSRTVVRRLHFP